jgi:galacturan 1,4-alpha-galacturonidase
LTVFKATNVVVKDIKMVNSPEWFNLVNEGKNVVYDNLTISAVSTSTHGPANTDGWNVYRSDQVVIKNSLINNGEYIRHTFIPMSAKNDDSSILGDDCVAFKVE